MPDESSTPAQTPASNDLFKKLVILAVCAVVPASVFAYSYTRQQADKPNAAVSAPVSTNQQPEGSPVSQAGEVISVYKDGTYEAVGHYVSPGGQEQVGVSLTIKDDIVTDATATMMATRPMSMRMQQDFVSNFQPMVIGVNLDDLMLTKVSGSSLTPKGFNDAVAQIKTQAQG